MWQVASVVAVCVIGDSLAKLKCNFISISNFHALHVKYNKEQQQQQEQNIAVLQAHVSLCVCVYEKVTFYFVGIVADK